MPAMMFVGAMAFIEKDGLVLIARRHPNHPNGDGGMWEMPSGRLEMGESLERGLNREVKEETSLEITIDAPVATWCLPERPLVGVVFACTYKSGEVRLTAEHTEHNWVTPQELLQYMTKPSMVASVNSYLEWKKDRSKIAAACEG
jgi:8-oxo-dGTP diphosphatase